MHGTGFEWGEAGAGHRMLTCDSGRAGGGGRHVSPVGCRREGRGEGGGSERDLLFLLLMDSLVPGLLSLPAVQRGWRAGASYCLLGSLGFCAMFSQRREIGWVCVCVCDVGRALSAPVKPWSEQARGLGSACGRAQGLRIALVEGMSHRLLWEWVLLLAGDRGGLGVEGRDGVRLGWTGS